MKSVKSLGFAAHQDFQLSLHQFIFSGFVVGYNISLSAYHAGIKMYNIHIVFSCLNFSRHIENRFYVRHHNHHPLTTIIYYTLILQLYVRQHELFRK